MLELRKEEAYWGTGRPDSCTQDLLRNLLSQQKLRIGWGRGEVPHLEWVVLRIPQLYHCELILINRDSMKAYLKYDFATDSVFSRQRTGLPSNLLSRVACRADRASLSEENATNHVSATSLRTDTGTGHSDNRENI